MNKGFTVIELVLLIIIMILVCIGLLPMMLFERLGWIKPRVLTEEELTHVIDR
jgi:hypothetical protein